ncbi:uncharacterized protein LOC131012238 [Salvia miltiorrhiza]|uniref:uncharacterized protein LOC131012238 n=1 Tax=Salvia miltiorrhiza TaxID=226208 RepID=UPI0025ABE759|nr:uncharacterized protein LOC131012238 [Salvia miltiorrhiza]
MLRFLGKTTASAARSGGSNPTEACIVSDEVLSAWELVNASLSDDEDLYSYDSEETASTGESVSADDLEPVPAEEDGGEKGVDEHADLAGFDPMLAREIIKVRAMVAAAAIPKPPPIVYKPTGSRYYAEESSDDSDVNDVEEDDDDTDDDYDFDDELVPWKLKGRFEKQRITKMGTRKMGQRGGPKLTAKKLPYYDNRPGFAHGKLR